MEYLRFRYIFSKLAELVKWQKNDFTNYILRKALVNQRFICSMANWDWIGLFMVSENVTGTVCWHLRKWMKFFPKSVKHLANVVCMSCELLLRPVWKLTLTCLIKWTPPLQTLPLMIYQEWSPHLLLSSHNWDSSIPSIVTESRKSKFHI